MKKGKVCFILIFSFLLTGCSDVAMTQTESGQVSEYIAYSLLKFNKNPEMLIEQNEEESKEDSETAAQLKVEETEKTEVSERPTSQSGTEEPADKMVTAGEVFGNRAFSVSVSKSGLYDNYPEDNSDKYFALTAPKGSKLLVVELTIKNTSDKPVKFKTNIGGMSYSLSGSSDKALTTMLENDVHFFNENVKPGKSIKAKLIYEVNKDYKLDTGKIQVANNGKSIELAVK